MSAISSLSMAYYTAMSNNSMMSWINASNARMGLLNSANNVNFGSLESISNADTQLELQMLSDSLLYKMSQAMLKNLQKKQKEEYKLNTFA